MECKKRSADEDWSNEREVSWKLIPVRKADVPEYLHRSEFYQSLEESDGEFLVPSSCLKLDDHISNCEDLRWLLITLRFWIADSIIRVSSGVCIHSFV